MAIYRTTVILKTDIVDSTPRLAEQTQAEMSLQRRQHKQFVSETAAKYHGSIFQEEGDAYWMEFQSVTNACLAAIEMHQDLRLQQAGKGEKERLAIRAAITVGDILHEGNDTMGTTMSLTARIEKITPSDEIYLSHAAWLVLNKAEIQTSFVNEFNLKGFDHPEKIYKVDQKYKTRVIKDQYIVFTDVRGWTAYTRSEEIQNVENFLLEYDDLLNDTCEKHHGVIRDTSGDQYFMTFSDAESLFSAMKELCLTWKKMVERYQLGLSVAIHKGDLNIIRSYLYGNDIHVTVFLERLNPMLYPGTKTISVIASNRIRENAIGTKWEPAFHAFDINRVKDNRLTAIIDECGAFLLNLEEV